MERVSRTPALDSRDRGASDHPKIFDLPVARPLCELACMPTRILIEPACIARAPTKERSKQSARQRQHTHPPSSVRVFSSQRQHTAHIVHPYHFADDAFSLGQDTRDSLQRRLVEETRQHRADKMRIMAENMKLIESAPRLPHPPGAEQEEEEEDCVEAV